MEDASPVTSPATQEPEPNARGQGDGYDECHAPEKTMLDAEGATLYRAMAGFRFRMSGFRFQETMLRFFCRFFVGGGVPIM